MARGGVTRRAVLLAAASALAILSVVLVATPRSAAASATPLLSGPYVALGDSYAAGPLILNQVDLACLRSDHDYPALVAASIHPAAFRDVSCSGATTTDISQSQSGTLMIPVAPQFNVLSPDTALVTLSIGGNDIGFSRILATCSYASLTNPFGSPCQAIYTAGGTDQLAGAIAGAAPKVAAVLQGIHQRAPSARVLLVGYLDILPIAGPGCWPLVPIAAGDVAYLGGIEVQLNQMLAQQAGLNSATYVDAYSPSIGHDACQLPGTKWVEGLVPTSPGAPIHPNEFGMQATAAAVLSALG